ncbi:MAG: NapC/NirT family cytochrome c [Gemmatimonadetes bacterium]|nr:NapC/NirT family cytochrome c [Gemmatimonadota bacterium]
MSVAHVVAWIRGAGAPDPEPRIEFTPPSNPAAKLSRLIFDAPQAVQVAVAMIGLVLVGVATFLVVRHRRRLLAWVKTRPRWMLITAASVLAVFVALGAWGGLKVQHYIEHENAFCTSCHLMHQPIARFETTKHDGLECHDCHRQSQLASMRQLYFWVVERPGEVKPHAKVPDRVCEGCHDAPPGRRPARGDTAVQVAAMDGHRVHLDRTKQGLERVACVTCHGMKAHEFTTSDRTCAQGGCHEDQRITLAKMATAQGLECTACHNFRRTEAARPAPFDSLPRRLVPDRKDCQSCHQMREKVTEAALRNDPHGKVCGACHDPHRDHSKEETRRVCVKCHERPDTLTPFHRGVRPATLADCVSCHKPHGWKVSGNQCEACHQTPDRRAAAGANAGARGAHPSGDTGGSEATRPAPSSGPPPAGPPGPTPAGGAPTGGHGASGDDAEWATLVAAATAAAAGAGANAASSQDSAFSHRRHASVPCRHCHDSSDRHGAVLVKTKADCRACHHSGIVGDDCVRCHRAGDARPLPQAVEMRASAWVGAKERTLPFVHARHVGEACAACHTSDVARTVTRPCASCHEKHHTAQAACATCHDPAARPAHDVRAHLGCGGASCHQDAAVARLDWSRNLCLACHPRRAQHEPGRDCAACHAIPGLHRDIRRVVQR